jgi:hypothetical protein
MDFVIFPVLKEIISVRNAGIFIVGAFMDRSDETEIFQEGETVQAVFGAILSEAAFFERGNVKPI